MLGLVWHTTYMCAFVFALGFVLHYYAFKRGIADQFDKVKTEALKKGADGKKKDYKTGNGLLDKWLDFGGGYYGIIAFIQLIFIEIEEIQAFILGWTGLDDFLQGLGISTLISLFIEQIMNFVQAISWPAHYLGRYSILQIAIFIALTYLVYTLSRKLARARLNRL